MSASCFFFHASWNPASVHIASSLLPQLSKNEFCQNMEIKGVDVEGEEGKALCQKHSISTVPSLLVLSSQGSVLASLPGATPPLIFQTLKKVGEQLNASAPQKKVEEAEGGIPEELRKRLEKLVSSASIMVFMKGDKEAPFCKFSKSLVAIFQKYALDFSSFNILKDEEVRQGLKIFSNWPTYPQIYVDGTFLGGVDLVKELDEEGCLEEEVNALRKEETMEARLTKLVRRSPLMLFMKGTPASPFCGFSAKIIEILEREGLEFDSFDILKDAEVRAHLKEFSNWPTYPQLYANGQLIGGLDVVMELAHEGALKEEIENAMAMQE